MKHAIVKSILFVVFFSCTLFAGENYWTGQAGVDWFDGSNWSAGIIPGNAEVVFIGAGLNSPVIQGYNNWANTEEVYVGHETGSPGTLTIDNFAGLDIDSRNGDLFIGQNANGFIYLNDGFIWCRDCYVNYGSWGQLEITSGGLTCERLIVAGRVNLYGFAGYIETSDLEFTGSNKAIEIKHGRIVWHGDHRDEIQDYINQGLIYCAGGTVLYDYDFSTAGATTVYATTKEVVEPFIWNNQHNKVISGKFVRNFTGHGIELNNCTNITIEDCEFGPCYNNAVDTYEGNNITVNNCKFRHCQRGVWFWKGGADMKVLNSWFLNSLTRGQNFSHGIAMCQCIGTGLEIRNNRIQNQGDILDRQDDPGERRGFANVCDNINTYKSEGTAQSPLLVENNWIKNWDQVHNGGCGITTGDQGGEYNLVRYNRIVNAQYGGISIAGGRYANIHHNLIYSDDKWNDNGGGGVIVWDYYPTYDCHSHTVTKNFINFTTYYGKKMCLWQSKDPLVSCGTVTGWDDNYCDSLITPDDILPGNIFCEYNGMENYPQTDLDHDCFITLGDLAILTNFWLQSGIYQSDYTNDQAVNEQDLNMLMQEWLMSCQFPVVSCP